MKNLKKTNKYYTDSRPEMIDFVPIGAKRVLDIGCGEGLFLLSLKKRSNVEAWGVEINHDIAEKAKTSIDKIIEGDISNIVNDLPESYFDCIVLNDVLEHMVNPYVVLEKIKTKLSTNGVIVCSIPNVRHIRVLRDLLFKKQWKYEESGILDKTHLRFFTKKSILDMFDSLNYEVLKIEGINGTELWKFFPVNVLTLGLFADSRYIQFACVAKPKL